MDIPRVPLAAEMNVKTRVVVALVMSSGKTYLDTEEKT